MGLGKIVGTGILVGGLLANPIKANSDPIYPWQVQPGKREIIVHIKRGDTLSNIINYLDHSYGSDNSYDAAKKIGPYLRNKDIIYANCDNSITNENIIEAGRDLSITGQALDDIDPNYSKNNTSENKDYERGIAEKNIQIKTENKIRTPRHKERSLIGDISRVRDYSNKEDNKIGKFVLSGEIGYSIFGEGVGEGVALDLSAGYKLPGIAFKFGGRVTQIDESKYYEYKRSLLGLLYEAELDEEYLNATELYIQLMFGSDIFKIGGGYGVKNIKVTELGSSYGWWEGEGGINKDYDSYKGGFGALEIMFPIDKNLSAGIGARHGEYKGNDGLKLSETTINAKLEAKF